MSDEKAKTTETPKADPHPGMMGDGTEEQNLNQPGNPAARVTEEDVKAAFETEKPAPKT